MKKLDDVFKFNREDSERDNYFQTPDLYFSSKNKLTCLNIQVLDCNR